MFKIVKRKKSSLFWLIVAPNLAILMTLVLGALMFSWLGFDPFRVIEIYFIKPLSSMRNLTELALKASPLILIGLGLSFVFRANIWNIGAEGQYILGAICGSSVALIFYDSPNIWILPFMIFSAILGGVLWAIIPAFLRVFFNVSEILSSLMLNYIAIQLLLFLTHGILKDPQGNNFPYSKFFNDDFILPILFEGTRLNIGFAIVILLAIIFWLFHSHSLFGFRIKVSGLSEKAARYAGINQNKMIFLTMALSGGLAGLAGIFEVAGPIGQITAQFPSNYGYTAIIVAFLGRLHPLGIVLAGFIIALTYLGSELAQISIGLPLAVTGVFQSMLLFLLLGCDFLRTYRIQSISKH